jgi:hypothetical protein
LVGLGSEVVTEVAQRVLDVAEHLVVGQFDECVGEAFEEAFGLAAEGLEELPAAFFTPLGGRRRCRSGVAQHGGRPGVRLKGARRAGSNSPAPGQST